MFFQLSTFIITSLAMLAVASPVQLDVRGSSSSCGDNNNVYCCAIYQPPDEALPGWLGGTGGSMIGITCNIILDGGKCPGSQPSCCSNTYFVGYLFSRDPNKYLTVVL
ncbi:hypothetical protein SCLCIDRAFT_24370 [Scleroderma citrinum Foug A]|uniref:Hydrophobin n=1 Tax=Scleroderma citrinum Foug A TaxID=1036808 RepID=A0A0C2ZNV5_9AGAM|nr:hypothetical protein SCLCIDRAFT_24370 [Scleroderma citrinum Foug A]